MITQEKAFVNSFSNNDFDKICEIDNTQKQAPLPREHSANVRYLEKAERMPTREKIKKRKNRKDMSVVEMTERKKGRRR